MSTSQPIQFVAVELKKMRGDLYQALVKAKLTLPPQYPFQVSLKPTTDLRFLWHYLGPDALSSSNRPALKRAIEADILPVVGDFVVRCSSAPISFREDQQLVR